MLPLAVTMGDPAGIGPDITLFAWRRLRDQASSLSFFVVGDPAVFVARASLLGIDAPVERLERPEQVPTIFGRALPVLACDALLPALKAGSPAPSYAPAVISSIETAIALTVAGHARAVVTNPIAKYVLLETGFRHAGHTEFLAELAARHGFSDVTPIMMMASQRLKAVPVTVHIPLKDVPGSLTKDRIMTVASITSDALSRFFGSPRPRLAVCGLNPHAGENGALGREEIDIIAPAIAALNDRGIDASGPHSADTLFHDEARAQYDAVLAMYHDQALIPFKTLSFADGVNVTLGLPFIRTSPDHGTAFSLAGTGKADPRSFIEALRLAAQMSERSPAGRPVRQS